MSEPVLLLASASPRRAALLAGLGVAFRVRVSEVDETPRPDEPAHETAARLAREKAAAVARGESLPVLAADTLVVIDGLALGKPASAAEARAMLARLQGRSHEVVTGVCLLHAGRARAAVERSEVVFHSMSPGEIDWYVATGEPLDKAGGYHVDGRGALFISGVHGSPSNVAGLPVRVVLDLLRQAGIATGLPR